MNDLKTWVTAQVAALPRLPTIDLWTAFSSAGREGTKRRHLEVRVAY
jgi:hypothetical protein